MLGQALQQTLRQARGEEQIIAWDKEEIDITNEIEVNRKIKNLKPEIIINVAAYNAVDRAEEEPALANLVNGSAVGFLAQAAKETGAVLVHYSTGYVFDGTKNGYKEDDPPKPINAYGRSKFLGEKLLRENYDRFYLIRTNLLYGRPGRSDLSKPSFVELMLKKARETNTIEAVSDEISNPTYVKDLALATIDLINQEYPFGIYHLVNEGQASWSDWAKEIFGIKKIEVNLVSILSEKLRRSAPRPKYSTLSNTKFTKLRPWPEALREYLSEEKL